MTAAAWQLGGPPADCLPLRTVLPLPFGCRTGQQHRASCAMCPKDGPDLALPFQKENVKQRREHHLDV